MEKLSFIKKKDYLWNEMKSRRVREYYSNKWSKINSEKRLWLIIFTKEYGDNNVWHTKFWVWDSYEQKIIGENKMYYPLKYIKVDWEYSVLFMSHGTGVFVYDFKGIHKFVFKDPGENNFYHRFLGENELFMIGNNQQAFVFDLTITKSLKDKPINIKKSNYEKSLEPSIIFRNWDFAISDWTSIHRNKECFVFVGVKNTNAILGRSVIYKNNHSIRGYYVLSWQSETRKDMSPKDSVVMFDNENIIIQNRFVGTDLYFEQKLPIELL